MRVKKTLKDDVQAATDDAIEKYRKSRGAMASGARYAWNAEREKEFQAIPVETLLDDPYFLGVKDSLYPKAREDILRLWNDRKEKGLYKFVDTEGIGAGKTWKIGVIFYLLVYELLCHVSPQKYYNLAPNTNIALICLNKNEWLAKKVTFTEVLSFFESHLQYENGQPKGFFADYFPLGYDIAKLKDPGARFPAELIFAKNVRIFPGTARAASYLGYAVHSGVVDEANWLKLTEDSKEGITPGMMSQVYDAAQDVYDTLLLRMGSRNFLTEGKMKGLACFISSKRFEGDFTSRLWDRAANDDNMLAITRAIWKAKPAELYASGRTFDFDVTDMKVIEEDIDEPAA